MVIPVILVIPVDHRLIAYGLLACTWRFNQGFVIGSAREAVWSCRKVRRCLRDFVASRAN